jgi:predicted SAM-dependent methyltransferase
VVPGWQNLDKSPSVYLAQVPRLRTALARLKILRGGQVSGLPRGVVHADVTRGLPYANGSVEFIYSGHMIEHLSRWQGLQMLRECHRVMRPGGVIRIVTPDLRILVESYLANDFPEPLEKQTAADSFMSELNPRAEIDDNIVRRFLWRNISGTPHQWLYDYESLSVLLTEAGFTDPTLASYREGRIPDLDRLEHRPRSVFVEASRRA